MSLTALCSLKVSLYEDFQLSVESLTLRRLPTEKIPTKFTPMPVPVNAIESDINSVCDYLCYPSYIDKCTCYNYIFSSQRLYQFKQGDVEKL